MKGSFDSCFKETLMKLFFRYHSLPFKGKVPEGRIGHWR